MKTTKKKSLPIYRDFLAYLRGLGFTTTDRYEYGVICRHAATGCWLAYQDRKPTDPILHMELLTAHHHLTWQGVIDDVSFDDFVATLLPAKAG